LGTRGKKINKKRRSVMRNKFLVLAATGLCIAFASYPVEAQAGEYYARCNMRVVEKGNYVTWENYRTDKGQRDIPIGTKLTGDGETMTDPGGTTFKMKMGASGDQYLEKFVSKMPVSVEREYADDVKNAVPKVGMTKEQVYMAMCPPAYIDGKNATKNMTYDEIMKSSFWVWKRMSTMFAKDIGVKFDSTGKAEQVEGVYGK